MTQSYYHSQSCTLLRADAAPSVAGEKQPFYKRKAALHKKKLHTIQRILIFHKELRK